MRIYKCDRCGKYVRIWDIYEIKMQFVPPFCPNRTKQLCEECYRILCEWFKDPETKELRELFGDPKAKEESE